LFLLFHFVGVAFTNNFCLIFWVEGFAMLKTAEKRTSTMAKIIWHYYWYALYVSYGFGHILLV